VLQKRRAAHDRSSDVLIFARSGRNLDTSDLVRVAERRARWGATLMPDRVNGNGPAAVERMAERKGFNILTPRERDVLAEIISGASNKEAGRSLKISPRTIEIHRARIMDKLGAKNAADLVRIALGRARH
jgi:DNA-binding CsgD family transcriptional regulator